MIDEHCEDCDLLKLLNSFSFMMTDYNSAWAFQMKTFTKKASTKEFDNDIMNFFTLKMFKDIFYRVFLTGYGPLIVKI